MHELCFSYHFQYDKNYNGWPLATLNNPMSVLLHYSNSNLFSVSLINSDDVNIEIELLTMYIEAR